MHRPKPPAACADLDLALVERTLSKHLADIPASARELAIPTPDLRRLTWARPDLLEAAELECMGIVHRAMSVLFEALDSDEPRRREWAAEKILSSHLARNHPFAPARRGVEARAVAADPISFRWADADASAVMPPAEPIPAPPLLPIWPGRDPPPPLVSGQYAPWERR